MKANQNFRRDDEAVSPVIGVILMVAITVVLAAVVFVLVNNLGEGAESAPNVTFQRSEANDRLTVVTAPTPAVPWSDFTIRAQGAAAAGVTEGQIHVAKNAAPHHDTDQNTVGGGESDLTGNVSGGDYLQFCSRGTGPAAGSVAASDITITVSHTPSGTLVGSFTFASIAACPAAPA